METVVKTYIVMRDGEARIAGNEHLKAEYVARRYVNGGDPVEKVMEHYGLSRAEVHAALAYFYENQETLDLEYQEAWEESRRHGAKTHAERVAEIEARMKREREESSS
jgi:uncharacterized protein (DUF433 family)